MSHKCQLLHSYSVIGPHKYNKDYIFPLRLCLVFCRYCVFFINRLLYLFLSAFAKLRRATISFVKSVLLSARKISAPTGRIFMIYDKLQTYNKINGGIRRHFGKQMNKETKLRIHNITAKATLKFGSEAWVLRKREEQRLEAAQMTFLRHLLGIT